MKKTLLKSVLLCFAISCVNIANAAGIPLDNIVAVVNDDVVTQSEFNHSLSITKAQLSQAHVTVPPANVFNKQVLNQLINKKLQLQIAKQVGISVTDSDVDNVISNVASKNNLSISSFYQQINQEGMATADYRNEIRDQLTIQRLQQQEVGGRLTVTPDEINSFMRSKIWQSNAEKEYHLEDILIPISDTPSPEEINAAKTKAEATLARLRNGESFRTVAQSESGDKNALAGGDLGWRKLPEIPSAFSSRVVSMKNNEVAGPIQTANGFHIIHLAEERATGSKQNAPDRKQIENLLLQRKFEEHVQNWVSKMRGQAFIVMNQIK